MQYQGTDINNELDAPTLGKSLVIGVEEADLASENQ